MSPAAEPEPTGKSGNEPDGYSLLTDGSSVLIRQATPEDFDAVRDLHSAMSPDNIYLRFFSMSPASADREAKRLCRPPEPGHVALIAARDDAVVGVASYEMTGPDKAEVAFAVADEMHGRGVATLLLDYLVSIARQHHVRGFTAQVLADNSAMLKVFADAGLPVRRRADAGIIEIDIPLPAGEADASLADYLDAVSRRESGSGVASLTHLLRPARIAVIGASRREDSVGGQILSNIVSAGYQGAVYPVNPHADTLHGLACLRSASELPRDVDLAVVAVPAGAVADVAEQCGRRGVRSLLVITSGLGADGARLLATCRRHGMRLVGPNCFGLAVPGLGLDATFGRDHPLPGRAGLAVQSGGIGISISGHLSRLGIGVSSFVSVGDKLDVSGNDLLTWWEQDGSTTLAILYLESFGNPRKFARTARRIGQRIPVMTVIGGRSAAGQRAAASHTAAAATPLVTREALFGQAGVVVAASLGELIGTAALLSCQPLPAGGRVAVVSNAGGAGVLAADACGDSGLELAALSEPTLRRLTSILPAAAAIANPLDTTAAVSASTFRACLEAVAADESVDAVISVAAPTAMADLTDAMRAASTGKPHCAVVLDQLEEVCLRPGKGSDADGRSRPYLPSYAYPEGAAAALGHAARYSAWRSRPQGTVPALDGVHGDDARALVAGFLAGNPAGGWLPAPLAGQLLDCYQIPRVSAVLVGPACERDVLAAAAALAGPVVLKAEVPGLVHKTEAGGVKLDLRSQDEVARAYRDLSARFGDRLAGVVVQPMAGEGAEVLIGVASDPVFGPLVVFGLGGVATDILHDHAARLTPLTDTDARELVRGVRAARLLDGYPGRPAADADALADVLLRVARLADDVPEVAALDLNPVLARADGCVAVDARVQVFPVRPADPYLRQLR
jgi:acyl-CoA synthetase (NDP forming)/GNAT superfamily N-acetyltransferase